MKSAVPSCAAPRIALACLLALAGMPAGASDLTTASPTAPMPARKASEAPLTAKEIGDQVRAAIAAGEASRKNLPLIVDGKNGKVLPAPVEARKPAVARPTRSASANDPQRLNQQYLRARGIPLPGASAANARKTGSAPVADHAAPHWSYEGAGGPQNWARLQAEFATCADGRRQSPINIESGSTLLGPAETIRFSYQPSQATVVNNGHTIQVDLANDSHNTITVRDTTYRLTQFHFHHPAEERVNGKAAAMVAHLVHRSPEGQLAVVAVPLEPGEANPLIDKVWTYLPLDIDDRVRMPAGLLNLAELLPTDQRYYQYMGSLTTPPCTEGVLWLVFKQPTALSPGQLRLFGQLYPNNARPVQPLHGRPVREAQ